MIYRTSLRGYTINPASLRERTRFIGGHYTGGTGKSRSSFSDLYPKLYPEKTEASNHAAYRSKMAEGQGFEPWKGVNPCRFSRPVHSTALPSLHGRQYYRKLVRSQWDNDASGNVFENWMF